MTILVKNAKIMADFVKKLKIAKFLTNSRNQFMVTLCLIKRHIDKGFSLCK